MTRYWGNGKGAGGQPDTANTVERVMIASETPETNVTVVVTCARMPKPREDVGQAYALVLTGNLRPRYHLWMTTVRAALLEIAGETGNAEGTDESANEGFLYVDLFKRGTISADNVALQLEISKARASALIDEADLDGDGLLQPVEWAALVRAVRAQTRVPQDPVFFEGPIDTSILSAQLSDYNVTFSAARRPAPPTHFAALGVALVALLALVAVP
jgi:hypothetical protein